MRGRWDDELPDPIRLPRPRGWFELFCCSTILVVFVASLVVIGLTQR